MSDKKISTKVLCAIFATGILSFCGVAGETAMNITFPVLMKAFSVNTSTVQWVTTIYLLVVACVVPLSAYLKRSFKMKTIFLVANLLSILGVLIDFIAPSFGFVVLGRLVQGMGVGFALPLMFNIILEQVPSRKIGLMMGSWDTDYSRCTGHWTDCWWSLDSTLWLAFYLPRPVSYSPGFTDCRDSLN